MKSAYLLLATLFAGATNLLHAQIQTAETLLIDVDATSVVPGTPLERIVNSGSLGGYFEASGGGTTLPVVTTLGGVNGIAFDGTNDYLQLVSAAGGSVVAPPSGIVGVNASVSVEIWAFNPSVGTEESMVSWGKRGTAGANSTFGYGYSGQLGAVVHHGSGPTDLGWDDDGGAPSNNRWHHLVYTYDGTTSRVFADGVLLNSETMPINVATSAGILLGAQWNNAGTAVGGQFASLALAKVRVHDGALTATQVLNNFNVEKSAFLAGAVTPQVLSTAPTHRYSFNETETNDANGMTFKDSLGGADGVVQASSGETPPRFQGGRLILPGGPVATGSYGDLPNGLVSVNSTNHAGTGEFSVETWFKVTNTRSWSHVFDFGSCGALGESGFELPGPGGNSGYTMLDDFMYGAQVSGDVNRHRLEWANRDPEPGGATTNATRNLEITEIGVFNTDRHLVVTWKESTGDILAYENGALVGTLYASNSMSALNDLNNWLGRSQYGDNTLEGEYDEFRLYNRVLTAGEVLGNFQAGPDVVNTNGTLAIVESPQSRTVYEGFPVKLAVAAGGTPPLYFQWLRNGVAVQGATNRMYEVVAAASDDGAGYSVVVSNLTSSVTSSAATLTVTPNQAPPVQFLYERRDGNRDNYSGVVGGAFQVGANDVPVTHLGYYDVYADGLNQEHRVGIWSASGGTNPLAYVTVPAGADTLLTNGYRWVALASPLLLKANTTYLLGAEVFSSSGDGFPDNFPPLSWNPYFVGANGYDTRQSRYGSPWPDAPMSPNQQNGIYAAANLATIPMGSAAAGLSSTTITQYAGANVTLSGAVGGQPPVTVQWYKAPGTLLAGQTNSVLVLSNVTVADAGQYYLVASGQGTAESDKLTLVVLNDMPVSITQQPANLTVPEGFPAAFSVLASGTPPIGYQWQRNGITIPDATNSTYRIQAATLAENGDIYSAIASNTADGTPRTATSAGAVLTVVPNKAPAPQALHSTWSGFRDNFSGMAGGVFVVNSGDSLVTHLGFYDANEDGLNQEHRVGLWRLGSESEPFVSVTVPVGTEAYFTNGYRYVALDPPLVLTNNTTYILGGESFADSGDGWPDAGVTPEWNPYYVGAQAGSTRDVRYASATWPSAPTSGSGYAWGANRIYGAVNLAALPVGTPKAWVTPTAVTQYVGLSVALQGLVNGDPPLVAQWYKGSGTILTGQTNLGLALSELKVEDTGEYYLVASNTVTGQSGQSAKVAVAVLATAAPSITQQPQSQTVYPRSRVSFAAEVSGTPPFTYQWLFGGQAIPNATNVTLSLEDVTSANAGDYQLTVTNAHGNTSSAVAKLSIIPVPAGSYAAAAMSPDLLLYYRLNEVATGSGVATNQGSLGFGYNGTYRGGYGSASGPAGFSNFEADNSAVLLDGASADVLVPSPNIMLSRATIVAWVNKGGDQVPDAAIFFHRGSDVFGLSVYPDPLQASDGLRYTWKGTFYTFTSGLILPFNKWALVAMSIAPDSATLYVQDDTGQQSATNYAVHAECNFAGDSFIGWDSAGGESGRRWAGAIDEVMVFDRTLSAEEINRLYLGLPGSITLQVERAGQNMILTWPEGVLLEANELVGPWTPVNSAVSPHTVPLTGTKKFYRVQL